LCNFPSGGGTFRFMSLKDHLGFRADSISKKGFAPNERNTLGLQWLRPITDSPPPLGRHRWCSKANPEHVFAFCSLGPGFRTPALRRAELVGECKYRNSPLRGHRPLSEDRLILYPALNILQRCSAIDFSVDIRFRVGYTEGRMKTIVDLPTYTQSIFREFGLKADVHPAILGLQDALIEYVTAENLRAVAITPQIRAIHVTFERDGRENDLIVTFSETATEIFMQSLLVVAASPALLTN
jgi:hypothetical protein